MTVDSLDSRAGLYALLRRLYSYPLTRDVLETVRDLEVFAAGDISESLEALDRAVGTISDDRMAELNIEMTRLVEGPGLTPAPPYASYYLNHGTLMGAAASEARRTYLSWHVLPDSEVRLPDDHITYELGFMGVLAEAASSDDARTLEAIEASRAFLTEQLAPWIPRFCASLSDATNDPFFKALARLTAAMLRRDVKWLATPATADSGRGGLT